MKKKIIETSKKRQGQVFTPTKTVLEMLDMLDPKIWSDESTILFEPSCGDGVFVKEILKRRLKSLNKIYKDKMYVSFTVLMTIVAIDIDPVCVRKTRALAFKIIQDFTKDIPSFKNTIIMTQFFKEVKRIIKKNIHENDCLSALQPNLILAEKAARKTKLSWEWFKKNGHKKIDFQNL